MNLILSYNLIFKLMKNIVESKHFSKGRIVLNSNFDQINEKLFLSSISNRKNVIVLISSQKHHFGVFLSNGKSFKNFNFLWDRNSDVFFFHVFPSGSITLSRKVSINIIPMKQSIKFVFNETVFIIHIDEKGNFEKNILFQNENETIEMKIESFVVFECE